MFKASPLPGLWERERILSDVNLFRSTAAAKRMLAGERESPYPGVTTRRLALPQGSPNGARFSEEVGAGRREFSIDWGHGRVIAYVAIVLPATTHLSSRDRVAIAIMLRAASERLAHRVAHPSDRVITTSA
jgi:hypothetical protein